MAHYYSHRSHGFKKSWSDWTTALNYVLLSNRAIIQYSQWTHTQITSEGKWGHFGTGSDPGQQEGEKPGVWVRTQMCFSAASERSHRGTRPEKQRKMGRGGGFDIKFGCWLRCGCLESVIDPDTNAPFQNLVRCRPRMHCDSQWKTNLKWGDQRNDAINIRNNFCQILNKIHFSGTLFYYAA